MRPFGFLALTAFLIGFCVVGNAWADEPEVAEQLFREGHALLKEHRYSEACPKFAESQRRDPASGTLLALAYCQELASLLASAQASYVAAAELARAEKQDDRERAATERAQALTERLSTVTINVPEALWELPSLSVKSNGVELERAIWGRPVPSDGGNFEIEVSAANRTPWSTHLLLAVERDQRVVTVPLLSEPSEAALPTLGPRSSAVVVSAPPTLDQHYWTTPRVVGWAAIGTGAVAGIVSLYCTVAAKSAQNDVEGLLHAEENQTGPASSRIPWDASGHAREVDGRRDQALAQGFGVASGALILGGAALVLFGSNKGEHQAPSVSLAIAPGAAHVGYAKSF
jgi:hypothetical protein